MSIGKLTVYKGKPVVHGLRPDPRAWLGRERPEKLVAQGHFAAFDAALASGWSGGDWTAALQQQFEPREA